MTYEEVTEIKMYLYSAITATVGSNYDFNGMSVPLFGVPVSALVMAGAGAICAFAWPRDQTTRVNMYLTIIASAFTGAVCVSVIPALLHESWPEPLQPPLAFIFGLIIPWVMPAIRDGLPSLMSGLKSALIRLAGGKIE